MRGMEVRGLAFFALLLVAACGGGSNGGEDAPGVFVVTQVLPVDQAQNVPLTEEVNVVFSVPLDPASVVPGTVEVVAESGDPVPGDLVVSVLSPTVIRFLPRKPYFAFAEHVIRVGPALRDRNGRALGRSYEFRFQTEEEGPVLPTQADVENLGDLLAAGRWMHQMTLMDNQRFLVAGGYLADGNPSGQAEQLFPATKQSFFLPAAMHQARAGHVQVKLQDGRILLAGGETSSTPFLPITHCEIFDPATVTFAVTGPLNVARSLAAGVLLPDGRVLVVGGQSVDASGFHFRDDAEVFDPVAGTWTTVPSPMTAARSGHFAAVVGTGDVLVFGGSTSLIDADRWDAATGDFTGAAGQPPFPHFFGAGTVLPDGRPLVAGGVGSFGVTVWDPDFGFLSAVNPMISDRAFATATAFPDGRVLIAGGFDVNASVIHDTVDLFFPIGKTGRVFRPLLTLPRPTSHHAAALGPDGRVWLTGGLPPDLTQPGRRQVTVIGPGE